MRESDTIPEKQILILVLSMKLEIQEVTVGVYWSLWLESEAVHIA